VREDSIARERIDALRDILVERHIQYDQRFKAQEEAVRVAQEAQLRHDLRSNGLADKLAEQYKEFIAQGVTKDDYNRRHDELNKKVEFLTDFRSSISGRETVLRGLVLLIGALVAVLGLSLRWWGK